MKNYLTFHTISLFLMFIVLSGCKKDDNISNNLVKADFSFSGDSFVAPASITFINNSANANNYLWDFGDSTFSEDINPIHTYNTPGDYSVILTAYGSEDKSDEIVKTLSILIYDDGSYGTPFQNVPDVEDIIMYEINMRAFSNSGDFQGVIDRLDEIKALSVNVIWLMPIHPIGEINSVNSPYSVQNYEEVNPEFGDLSGLRTLVEEAHDRNIAIIIDWVANHTAWDNPWIEDKSWYTQDGNGDIIHPPGTNWLDVADLNFNNQEMRLAMIDALKYWILQANIDGYRCDAADMVPYSFWNQALDSLNNFENRDLILLAEGARSDHFNAGFQMNYAWDFYGKIKDVFINEQIANYLFSTHNSEYNSIPAGKHKLRFTTNHDESAWDATPMQLFNGKNGALAASVVTIYLGGVPLIYGSQEVGVVNNIPFFSNSPINWTINPDMLETYKDLLSFYSTSEVVKIGTLETYNDFQVVTFKKTLQNDEVLVIVNIRNDNVVYNIPAALQNTTWSNAVGNASISLSDVLELEPYEYYILIDEN